MGDDFPGNQGRSTGGRAVRRAAPEVFEKFKRTDLVCAAALSVRKLDTDEPLSRRARMYLVSPFSRLEYVTVHRQQQSNLSTSVCGTQQQQTHARDCAPAPRRPRVFVSSNPPNVDDQSFFSISGVHDNADRSLSHTRTYTVSLDLSLMRMHTPTQLQKIRRAHTWSSRVHLKEAKL